MNYLKLILKTDDNSVNDILVAHLSMYDFNGFSEEENNLIAYIEEENYTESVKETINNLIEQYNLNLSNELMVDQNWNAKWEADYAPVLVDDFCAVRATFHAPITTVKHEIVVTPKMSFGTGHHATTYMMMKQMKNLTFEAKVVFDYGCGTGVLAILAQKLGAKELDAIDIDKWAYENTLENIEINNCKAMINIYCGEITVAPTKMYDVVLANINRNVILNTMDQIAIRLKQGGYLLTSGFLEADIELVVDKAAKYYMSLEHKLERERWCCLVFRKTK